MFDIQPYTSFRGYGALVALLLWCCALTHTTAVQAQGKSTARRYRIAQAETVDLKDQKERKTTERYDRHGNTTELTEYDHKGVVSKRETYTYHRQQLTEYALYGQANQLEERHVYRYNKWDDEVEEQRYDAQNKLVETVQSDYNAQRQRTEQRSYDADQNLTKKNVYTYNNKGLIAERRTYDTNNQLVSTKTYTYQYR